MLYIFTIFLITVIETPFHSLLSTVSQLTIIVRKRKIIRIYRWRNIYLYRIFLSLSLFLWGVCKREGMCLTWSYEYYTTHILHHTHITLQT